MVSRLMHRSRQSYYKAMDSRQRETFENVSLMKLVQPIRQVMPRLGGRKLHFMLQSSLEENALKIGRDRFFRWLRTHDLLVRPKRSYTHTTQSSHRFHVYNNLSVGFILNRPNQLWVSDITYLRTLDGFCYLALITDAFSRKIVGYDVSNTLELDGCMRALKMALHAGSDPSDLIHHSDRGFQYCSNPYTALLKSKGIQISMAAKGNCYENALAERVNGILKDEFNLDTTFRNLEQAKSTVQQSILIYNQHRPHWSINLKTPDERHAA